MALSATIVDSNRPIPEIDGSQLGYYQVGSLSDFQYPELGYYQLPPSAEDPAGDSLVDTEHDIIQAEALVYVVPEMAEDKQIEAEAAAFIGEIALGKTLETTRSQKDSFSSLYDAIKEAKKGNEEAIKLIRANARADVIERTMKSGHISSIDLEIDELTGDIKQHGQTLKSIQANSLMYASENEHIRRRVEAETCNSFRIADLYHRGMLKDYSLVVFSMVSDKMSTSELEAEGFFTDTMSYSVQVTGTITGGLTIESAFMAGISEPGGERYDKPIVTDTVKDFGVDIEGKSTDEVVGIAILVKNSLIPNGVIDIVEKLDIKGEKLTGKELSFGIQQPRQNYQEYREYCREREERFKPKVDAIVNQLIAESDSINSLTDATTRLHKISEEQMIEQAVGDLDIDPRVFGPAAIYIEHARYNYNLNNTYQVIEDIRSAKRTASSNSCPGAGLNIRLE